MSGEPPELHELSAEEGALQEGFNSLLQLQWVEAALPEVLARPPAGNRYVQRHLIEELDALALNRLRTDGGKLRSGPVKIKKSRHKPPGAGEVSRLLDELCNYLNDNWESAGAFHLAAFALWRLNWIHPFVDGNGRTARAFAYYIFCAKLSRTILPGSVTIPELIALDREPYYHALEAADAALRRTGKVDVSVMEAYLELLYVEQLRDEIPIDYPPVSAIRERRTTWVTQSGHEREAALLFGNRNESLLLGFSIFFALLVLAFFMYLSLQPGSVACDRRFPVVVVLALGVALSAGCVTGLVTARGDLKVDNTPSNVLKFSASGGFAIFLLCLFIGLVAFRCDKDERHEQQFERERSAPVNATSVPK